MKTSKITSNRNISKGCMKVFESNTSNRNGSKGHEKYVKR